MDLNKEVPTLFAYCEKIIRKFLLKFSQGTHTSNGLCLEFFHDFSYFEGRLWGESFIGNI